MVTPYITFAGECSTALEFYKIAFGSTITMIQHYGDYVPENLKSVPENLSDWIMHAEMEICGTPFWFADEISEPRTQGNMVTLTLQVPDAKEARKIYDLLNQNAHITLPPTETFYSTFHAGLVDMFGMSWNITALQAPNSTE